MADNDSQSQQQTSEALALVLHELGQRMERLKQLYEQYFMGIERLEPLVARKEVTRTMLQLQQQYIRNTALRFKFNTMLQKWNIYLTYWNRTLREIENGTYTRHVRKAARAAEQKGVALPSELRIKGIAAPAEDRPAAPAGGGDDLSSVAREAEDAIDRLSALGPTPAKPGALKPPPLPAGARPPPLPPGVKPPPLPPGARGQVPPGPGEPARTPTPSTRIPTPTEGVTIRTTPPQGSPTMGTPPGGAAIHPPNVPGMSESELRALHKRYSEARASSGDKTPVRYETLLASIAKQVPRVLEQPGVRGVRFDVAMKDGKPVLKAIPTK